jgi:hypothetical protein
MCWYSAVRLLALVPLLSSLPSLTLADSAVAAALRALKIIDGPVAAEAWANTMALRITPH